MAKIKKIKLGSTTYDLCDADAVHSVKQDGITGATANRFGTCATAAATAAKTVSITAGTFSLETGAKVTVKFTNKNTAGTPTLNVNSTGAKNIFHNGAKITTGGNKALLAGTVEFVYDGTQWQLIGNYVDSHNSHTLSSGTKADGTTEIVGASSSSKLVLGASGVTGGTYGPTTDPTPTQGGTFSVPSMIVNDKGIVTSAATKTVTLPEETAISIVNKATSSTEKDTTDLVYVVSNLVESGTKNHTITPTYSGLPTKAYVDKVAAGHVKYLGTVTALTGLSTTAGQGDFYRVSTQFAFGTETAHVGDIILATKDNPAQNTTDWDLIHAEVDSNTWTANTTNAAGYVAAPTSSNPNKVWRTDGAGSPAWRDPSTPEAFLTWGGQNFTGAYGPIDAAMIPQLGANRFAFFPKANVVLESSTNGGTTWTAVNNDTAKAAMFSTGGASFHIGNNTTTQTNKTSYMCRVTLTTSSVCYSVLNKFAIYISTGGSSGCYCTLEARTKANQDAGNNSWTTFANKVPLEGWSGWNIINTSGITTHGNRTDQYSQLRFTFGVTSHAATVNYAGLSISRIMAFGGVGWATPSNMAASGDIYSYDVSQNVTFPGNVTAPTFIGRLQGRADALANTTDVGSATNPTYFTADGVPAACTYSLHKTVPSNAVFTDTKVTSADNHYSPTAASGAELTAAISGTAGAYAKDTEYTVVTGIKAQRDAKGHVTGLTYTAQKIKDTNNTYTVNNATLTLNVGGQTVSGNNAFTANDATNTTYNVPSATDSAYGVIKVSSVNSSAVTVNSESTTSNRYYPIELNSDGKAIVNVPWANDNTASATDNILDGSNSGTAITYAPYSSQQSKLSFDTSTTNPTRTDRLNINGYLYGTKLYSGGKEVLTSHQDISGKLDKNTAITGATKCKITYDSKGLVTSGANLAASDIPSLASSKITAMTSYSKASSVSAISTSDSLNTAIGKLEKALDGKLSTSGGTMTGHLRFKQDAAIYCTNTASDGTDYSDYATIQFFSGDANGCGIMIGAGGYVGIGSGESATALKSTLNATGGTEDLHLSSDQAIYLHTNCQTIANRKTITISTAGDVSAVSFTASSDKRLKENLDLYSCDKSILDLPIYKYNFINDEAKRKHVGCLAQDLQEICPEIVHTKEDGYLAIEESKIVYLLLDEVKKLKTEVESLKHAAASN